jgi:hypothetical protein
VKALGSNPSTKKGRKEERKEINVFSTSPFSPSLSLLPHILPGLVSEPESSNTKEKPEETPWGGGMDTGLHVQS